MKIIEYLSLNKPVLANFKPDLNYFVDRNLIQLINDSSTSEEIFKRYKYCLNASFTSSDNDYIKENLVGVILIKYSMNKKFV